MRPFGWFRAALLIALSIVATACGGEPPEKELQQAQGAIDAARAAGAQQYAREEYVAAQAALKRAYEAVEQRDFRLALNNALDSREQAQNAAKLTADNKATSRTNADRALVDAVAALTQARAKAKSPEAAKAPAKLLALRRAIVDTEVDVQKARAAFKEGDYPAINRRLPPVTEHLRDAIGELEPTSSASSRRRR